MTSQLSPCGLFHCLLFLFVWADPSASHAREATASDYIEFPIARLAILDKITARVHTIDIAIGETVKSQRLRIDLARCAKMPPEFPPQAVAFVSLSEVTDQRDENDKEQARLLFSKWMFASSPGLSAVEHPVYDVWLLDCLTEKE